VDIQRDAKLLQGFGKSRPKGKVRHKMPVHYIKVEQIGSGVYHLAHLATQIQEVSR
jgi:hypothetical protein